MAEERVSNPVADNGSVEVVPPDEQRCHKSNGKGWRCKKVLSSAHNPSFLCDHHYNATWYVERAKRQGRKLGPTHHPFSSAFKSQKKSRRMQQHERDLNIGLVSAAIPITIDASPLNSFREERSASRDRLVPSFEWNRESSSPGSSDNVTSPGRSSRCGLQASKTLGVNTAGVVRPAVANESQTCAIGTVGVVKREEVDVDEDVHVGANADQGRVVEGEQNVGLQSQSHEHLTPNNIQPPAGDSSLQASAPLTEREQLKVLVENPNVGVSFEQRTRETHSGHQLVGGFSVPHHFVPLYTKIWEKYGHIATTKVITNSTAATAARMTIVSSLLTMIEEMSDKTLNMVTGKMLEDWENQILTCEYFQFNVAWLRQRIDSIKADQLAGNVLPSLDAIKQEEEALIQEREKIRKMTEDLKVRTDSFNRITEMLVKRGKPLLDGLF